MSIKIFDAKLSDVIQTKRVNAGSERCGIGFLNYDFRAVYSNRERPAHPGAGVYGIEFEPPGEQARLIYVGLYRGKRTSPLQGNAARDRWWTHAGSFTMRGSKIHIAPRTASYLRENFPKTHPFFCLSEKIEQLQIDAGNGAGLNRVLFAERHWAFFGQAQPEEILERFRISYVRISEADSDQMSNVAVRVSQIENALKLEFKPACNDETKSIEPTKFVKLSEFTEAARCRLSNIVW